MSSPDPGSRSCDEPRTDAERTLSTAAIKGLVVDLRVGNAGLDQPLQGMAWGTDRQIRAELLVAILTGMLRPDGKLPRAVRLRGARITGLLNLEGATLTCPLMLEDCRIDRPVILDEATAPAIRMPGCHLTTLIARQLRTTGSLALDATFTATGGVNLDGAHIGGQLSLSDASLTNPGGRALSADGLTVDGSMFCVGFTATGEISLLGAHIGGSLELDGTSLSNPKGRALRASGLTVDQGMYCENGFSATGEIRMVCAHIGFQLSLSGAGLSNPEGAALVADGLTVGHDMFCESGFTATGEIGLLGAHIGGQLNLDGASLSNPEGAALNAAGLTVDRDMLCTNGFTATGEIGLLGAHINGQLNLDGVSLSNPGRTALALQDATVSTLVLLPKQQPDGAVDLTNARVRSFFDDPAGWPAVLRLRGFAYDSLENDEVSVRSRLRWLARHPSGYTPQLYDQLASTYRRAGDEEAYRKVAIAKQQRRRRAYSPLSWLWYATVGYGYRPWLAALWVIALVLVGTVVFSYAYPAHMMAISPHPPSFHATAYALDLLLPAISLGQKSAWQPRGSAYQYWSWTFTGAGWILSTAVVAGLTGILKRD